jgi:hypothetical protein
MAGRIKLIEKSNNFVGNRTRDLPACSIVPQRTTLQRAPGEHNNLYNGSASVLGNIHRETPTQSIPFEGANHWISAG